MEPSVPHVAPRFVAKCRAQRLRGDGHTGYPRRSGGQYQARARRQLQARSSALLRVRWKSWPSYISAAVPLVAWAAPVGTMMLFNWFTVGHLTGYDGTNEGSGFSIKYLHVVLVMALLFFVVGVVSLGDIALKHNTGKAGKTLSSVCHGTA